MLTVNVIHINGGYFAFTIPALCIFYHTRIPRISISLSIRKEIREQKQIKHRL